MMAVPMSGEREADDVGGRSQRLLVRDVGRVEYGRALAMQETLLGGKVAGTDDADYLLLLEHEPVYTLGRGADEGDLHGVPARDGVPVFRVGRGGGATFHGPGQLVAYPIIRLRRNARDVHRYVRTLERVLIGTCAVFGVTAESRSGLTGVWVGGEKLASIGIGVRRGVTWHGVALNVTTDVRYFQRITPCRLPNVSVTSLACLAGRAPSMSEVQTAFVRSFVQAFGYQESEVEVTR